MPDSKGRREDHEGLLHLTRTGEQAEYDIGKYTRQYDKMVCGLCGNDRWTVLASKTGPIVQLHCANTSQDRCPGRTKVLEFHKPQMTDDVARNLGLVIPDRALIADFEIDVPDEED